MGWLGRMEEGGPWPWLICFTTRVSSNINSNPSLSMGKDLLRQVCLNSGGWENWGVYMRGPHGQHRKGRFGEGRQNKQATLSDTHPFRFVTSKVLVVIQIQIQIQFQRGMQIQIRIQKKINTQATLTSNHLDLIKCMKRWNQMFEGDLFSDLCLSSKRQVK